MSTFITLNGWISLSTCFLACSQHELPFGCAFLVLADFNVFKAIPSFFWCKYTSSMNIKVIMKRISLRDAGAGLRQWHIHEKPQFRCRSCMFDKIWNGNPVLALKCIERKSHSQFVYKKNYFEALEIYYRPSKTQIPQLPHYLTRFLWGQLVGKELNGLTYSASIRQRKLFYKIAGSIFKANNSQIRLILILLVILHSTKRGVLIRCYRCVVAF